MPPDHSQTPLGTTDRFIQNNLLSRKPGLGPPLVDGDLGSLDGIRLVRELGAGGAATVYQGRIEGTDECVAVKVFTGEADDALRARVEQEAAVAGALNETGLFVRVKSYKKDHTPPYLVMDYIPGETLQERLARTPGGRLAAAEAALIACDVARGLQALHEKSFVHQDVKPGNVFLPEPGQASRPCAILLDLGAAFPFRTRGPKRAKTKAYASPEQLTAAGDITPRTDVYSFGMTLYHMLAGEPPPTRQPAEVERRLRGTGTHPAIADLCARCLAKDPKRRPPADEVIAGLSAYLGRWRRLRKRALLGLIALSLACFASVLVHSYLARREAAEQAEQSRVHLRAVKAEYDELYRSNVERSDRLAGRVTTSLTEDRNSELLAVPWLSPNQFIRERASRLRAALDVLEADPAAGGPEGAAIVPVARGTLAILDRRFAEALEHLPPDAVVRLAGSPLLAHRAHFIRGTALVKLDRDAEAVDDLRAAVALDPENFFAVELLALALTHSGRHAEAVETWDRYIEPLERALGGTPKPGGMANRLVMAVVGKAAAESEPGAGRPLKALETTTRAMELMGGVAKQQGGPRLDDVWTCCFVIDFEVYAEMGDRERALRSARLAITALRSGDGHAITSLATANRVIARLERMAKGATGADLVTVQTLLEATLCERAAVWIAGEKFAEAITDIERAMAITEKELRGHMVEDQARANLMIAYAIWSDARWKVGRGKFDDPTPGAVEGWVRLALADADRVVELAETSLRRNEPSEPEYRVQVEGRLGAVLWRRGCMSAEVGTREEAVRDCDRAVEILGRVVTHPAGGRWVVELKKAIDCRRRHPIIAGNRR